MVIPVFKTGVYSDDAARVFRGMFIWLSHSSTRTGRLSKYRSIDSDTIINKAANGEICVTTRYVSAQVRLTKFDNSQKFREWLAYQIKRYVYEEIGKEHWNRNDTTDKALPKNIHRDDKDTFVQCRALYFLYETLLNRTGAKQRYAEEVVVKYAGIENDPFYTQYEQNRRDMLAKLMSEHDSYIRKMAADEYMERVNAERAIIAKYKELKKTELEKYMTERTRLNNLKFENSDVPEDARCPDEF